MLCKGSSVFLSLGTPTEDDLNELAELMKSDMEDTLKIQRSPWLEWDVLEFEDVYLPVGLEKETDKGCVNDLREIFDANPISKGDTKKKRHKGHKILIKGAPGIGKTTVVSKMAYDWAVSTWNVFSLVFFVSLKMVKPGDPIENIIIDENVVPSVHSEGFDFQKVENILKTYGDKCVLILEGFDESIGKNKNIMNIIKHSKYASINIIVTTRPHVAGEIQRFFTTVVNVIGFTKDDAEKYIRALLEDKDKVESVLRFTEENKSIGLYEMWRYPILLLFVCILVNDGGGYLDLNDRNVTLTDIYTKLHECLYKRYIVKRGIEFSIAKKKHTLVQLGKLALKGLEQGRLLYQKRELEREVGKDAFHFGIIIGYKDRSIIHDLGADGTVSFLHQSIQEYLAALYMVDELEKSDRRIGDMWPGTWDYDTVSKVQLLLVFTIDLCKEKNTAKGKLLNSMAHVLNQENIKIQGNLLGKSLMSFFAVATQQCCRSEKFTLVGAKIPDDIETIYTLISSLSKKIVKVNFTHCKFQETSDYDLKYSSLPIVATLIKDFEFSDSDIPVATLKYLSQKGLLKNLSMVHTGLSIDDRAIRYYKDLLDLLSSPLPSLETILIEIERNIDERLIHLYEEQPHDLDDITDMTKYLGNLPNVKDLQIFWGTAFGKVFCDVIFACLRGNQQLEHLLIRFDFEMGGITDISRHALSLSYPNIISFWLQEYDTMFFCRKKTSELRQTMTGLLNHNAKEYLSFKPTKINLLDISCIIFFTEHNIHKLLQAIDGSNTLLQLRINNIVLPSIVCILQSKGLPELELLSIDYLCDMGNEPQYTATFIDHQAHVGCLPNLKKLEFKNLHGLMKIHQNLLKQFFAAVRGSHCLTVLDISGQNAAACLKILLFPDGLPALSEFRAEDCNLLPVDIYRLGKAAQENKLPSLKIILLSKNPKLSNHVCYFFVGRWSMLETIALDRIELTSWDITCLAHAAQMVDISQVLGNQFHATNVMMKTDQCILPNLSTIICSKYSTSALKKQMMSNTKKSIYRPKILKLCTHDKMATLMMKIDELKEEDKWYTDLGLCLEEITYKLMRGLDEDKIYCYGVVKLCIHEFMKGKIQEMNDSINISREKTHFCIVEH